MAAKTGLQFARLALRELGTPYRWGGSSPASGFDCSGLVEYALGQLGVNAPRTSESQYAWTARVPASSLKPGDLVFLNFPGENSPGHVMIWMGLDTVLQAPSTGQKVKLSHFDPQRPGTNEWGAQVVGYGRVKQLSYAGEPPTVITPAQAAAASSPGGSSSPSPSGGSSGGGGLLSGVPVVGGVVSAAEGTASFLGEITSAQFWIRALEIIGGGLILMLGLYLLAKQVGMGDDVLRPPTPGLSDETLQSLQDSPGIEQHRPAYRRSTEGVKRGKVTRHEVSETSQRRAEVKRRAKLAQPSDDVPF